MLPSFEELFVEDGPELQIIPQMVGEVEAADAVALHLLRVNDHLDIKRIIRLRYLFTNITDEYFQFKGRENVENS
jgi:hypothetical protein